MNAAVDHSAQPTTLAALLADPIARRALADAAEGTLECAGPAPHLWRLADGQECTAQGRTLLYLGFLDLHDNPVDRHLGRPADVLRGVLSPVGRDAVIEAFARYDYEEAEYDPAECAVRSSRRPSVASSEPARIAAEGEVLGTLSIAETVYTLSYLPEDDPEYRKWRVTVHYQERGLWSVKHLGYCLRRDGGWDIEGDWQWWSIEDWTAEHWFAKDDALHRARIAAAGLAVNGTELHEVLQQRGCAPASASPARASNPSPQVSGRYC